MKEPSIETLGERRYAVYTLRKLGSTFADIGKSIGVGTQRATQIFYRAESILIKDAEWWDGLSIRAFNSLNNLGIENREQAIAAFENGTLSPKSRRLRNYGWGTHSEIAKWLGFPDPVKKSIPKVCPHCGGKLHAKQP